MSVWKKIVAGVVVTALVVGAGAGGLNYVKKSRVKEVIVVPVESLASDYYSEDTTIDGNITTNVSQNISMDKDMVVENLYVSQGDSVKIGDPLVSFDMTLVNMELEIAKLKQQKLDQDLQKAKKRLASLKNGGPIEEDSDSLDADSLSSYDYDDDDDLASARIYDDGLQLAAAFRPFLLLASFGDEFDDFGGDTNGTVVLGQDEENQNQGTNDENQGTDDGSQTAGDENQGTGESDPGTDDGNQNTDNGNQGTNDGNQTAGNETQGAEEQDPGTVENDPQTEGGSQGTENQNQNQQEPVQEEPAQDPVNTDPQSDIPQNALPGNDDLVIDPADDFSPDDSDFMYADQTFHQVLDDTTEPYAGTGKKKDPFIFLCSSATGEVTAMGTFLNKMAGFSADGAEVLHPGGYWYLLEFHANDTIGDTMHREDSCTGYYLMDGGMLEEPTSMFAELVYTLADAMQYESEDEDDGWGDIDIDGDDDSNGSAITRQEAIKAQENRVRSIELDIQEGQINIKKLEKKTQNQIVYSRLDGIVASVGDPITGSTASNGAFVTVKSKEGFFVKGNISELMLDQIGIGSKLRCSSYEVGDFDAEVVDVSDYPSSSSDGGYYWGDSNPNVSYYSFSATVEDQSLELTDGDWIQIKLQTDASQTGKLVISKAFVRSENGMNYVYKSEDGILKKQYIKVGDTVDSGYSIMIQGGLSRKDLISFPYGDGAKEGSVTKAGTEDDLYE